MGNVPKPPPLGFFPASFPIISLSTPFLATTPPFFVFILPPQMNYTLPQKKLNLPFFWGEVLVGELWAKCHFCNAPDTQLDILFHISIINLPSIIYQ